MSIVWIQSPSSRTAGCVASAGADSGSGARARGMGAYQSAGTSTACPPSRASYRNVRRVDSGTESSCAPDSRSTNICRTRAALHSRCRSVRDAPSRAVQLLHRRRPRARRPGDARTPDGTTSAHGVVEMSNDASSDVALLFFGERTRSRYGSVVRDLRNRLRYSSTHFNYCVTPSLTTHTSTRLFPTTPPSRARARRPRPATWFRARASRLAPSSGGCRRRRPPRRARCAARRTPTRAPRGSDTTRPWRR